MITGAANRWSTGMSKNPWICALCRSIVSTRFVPGRAQDVRHELGRNRHARLVLAVLARVAVIRDHRRDARRRRPPERVDHDQQLHDVLVDRRAGRLHDEDVGAADVLVDLERHLGVREPAELGLPHRDPEHVRDPAGQFRMCATREDLHVRARQSASTRSRHDGWLGRKDSNLRMRDSKSRALPAWRRPTTRVPVPALARLPGRFIPNWWQGVHR